MAATFNPAKFNSSFAQVLSSVRAFHFLDKWDQKCRALNQETKNLFEQSEDKDKLKTLLLNSINSLNNSGYNEKKVKKALASIVSAIDLHYGLPPDQPLSQIVRAAESKINAVFTSQKGEKYWNGTNRETLRSSFVLQREKSKPQLNLALPIHNKVIGYIQKVAAAIVPNEKPNSSKLELHLKDACTAMQMAEKILIDFSKYGTTVETEKSGIRGSLLASVESLSKNMESLPTAKDSAYQLASQRVFALLNVEEATSNAEKLLNEIQQNPSDESKTSSAFVETLKALQQTAEVLGIFAEVSVYCSLKNALLARTEEAQGRLLKQVKTILLESSHPEVQKVVKLNKGLFLQQLSSIQEASWPFNQEDFLLILDDGTSTDQVKKPMFMPLSSKQEELFLLLRAALDETNGLESRLKINLSILALQMLPLSRLIEKLETFNQKKKPDEQMPELDVMLVYFMLDYINFIEDAYGRTDEEFLIVKERYIEVRIFDLDDHLKKIYFPEYMKRTPSILSLLEEKMDILGTLKEKQANAYSNKQRLLSLKKA
jgi:hypothetical protein